MTVTNIVLGLLVIVLLFGVVIRIVCEFVARWRRRRRVSHEIDNDMRRLFHGLRHR